MKIQCDSCGRAEAEVLCCADEAVLCAVCDETVHAANKLSSKHHRLSLLKQPHPPSSEDSQLSPVCDICQERKGYIFCLEDRALLCRTCDVGTHNSNPFTSSHRRFLITGVQVALQPFNSTKQKTKMEMECSRSVTEVNSASATIEHQTVQHKETITPTYMDFAASSTDTMAEFSGQQAGAATAGLVDQWPAVGEFLDNTVFEYSYDFSDIRSMQ